MAGKPVLVPHSVSKDEALKRLSKLVANPKSAKHLDAVSFERADGGYRFAGKVKGVTVSGDLGVKESVVRVYYKLPFAAQPFRSTVDRYIHDYLKQILA